MIQNARKRLPFLATCLAVTIGFMSVVQGEDKSPLTPESKTPASSAAKQVTMTGKVVNLHQYMTGETSSTTSIDRPTTSERITPADRTKPADSSAAPAQKHHQTAGMNNEIMGLETSTGLVLICFKDAPGVYATPRLDDAPAATPANPVVPSEPRTPKLSTTPAVRENDADHTRAQDSTRWQGKQVEVSGAIYEKNGIKFLVVSKVSASADTTKTIPRP